MAACKVAVLLRHVSFPVCTKVSHQVSGADSKQRSKYQVYAPQGIAISVATTEASYRF